jgi:ABC-type transport system involved in cytochrome bd biosynthesis fused ATPase/permease subunit
MAVGLVAPALAALVMASVATGLSFLSFQYGGSIMTFLLLCICVYLMVKARAAANVPREAAGQKQVISLVGTGIAWLVGKGLSARKG